MRPLAAVLCLGLLASGGGAAWAQAPEKPPTPQQQRMAKCNAEAKTQGLKGDTRRAFLTDCLKGSGPPAGTDRKQAQARARTCEAEAGRQEMTSDARQLFLRGCLAGRPAAGGSQAARTRACNAQAGERKLEGEARKTFVSGCLKG